MHELLVLWMGWVQNWGYAGIILLMAMESSIFPVPSEIVVPPAAIMASQAGASMTYWGVILTGTLGSWLGSAVTYGVSRCVGRFIVMKYGKFFFMPPHKVEKAETFMEKYSVGGVFFARLLPVIRHLISIPAGIIRMPFWLFSGVTLFGSFVWCWVLTWFGDRIGRNNPGILDSPEALKAAVKSESFSIICGVLVLAILYFTMLRLTQRGEDGKTIRKTCPCSKLFFSLSRVISHLKRKKKS